MRKKLISNSQERVASVKEVKQAIKRLRGRMRWLWNKGSYMVGRKYGLCVDRDGVWSWIGSEQEEWCEVEAGNTIITLIKPYSGTDIKWFLRQPLDELVSGAISQLEDLNYTIISDDKEVVP